LKWRRRWHKHVMAFFFFFLACYYRPFFPIGVATKKVMTTTITFYLLHRRQR
jgi:NRPS condensation-like uncharacterized protein